MLVIADRAGKEKRNVQSILELVYGKMYIVHRIDRDTSGALILAKTAEAHRAFSLLFQNRKIEKIYWAIVNGHPHPTAATISLKIAENLQKRGEYLTHHRGVEAITHYQVKEKLGNYALMSLHIETGRTHQIRVHMKAIQHPLAVDPIYNDTGRMGIFLSDIKRKYKPTAEEERPLLGRLSLHAFSIRFLHPFTEEEIYIEAPLFKDMMVTLKLLRENK
jgi:23S rRNA pseudouridine955/2504/2580 synthase/23S rRNA pseudouridine1911/1915/1917 synthase